MIIKKQKLDHSRLKSIILKYKIFSLLTKNFPKGRIPKK